MHVSVSSYESCSKVSLFLLYASLIVNILIWLSIRHSEIPENCFLSVMLTADTSSFCCLHE